MSTTSKAYQYRTPWDRPVTSTFTVQSRSALAVAMPALATLDESDQPKTVEPGAIGTRDPSTTGLASGSTAADVGGVVATLHRTSKDTFGSGSVSPGSRPVGVTRVQMTTESCVGSPEATPCTKAPCTASARAPDANAVARSAIVARGAIIAGCRGRPG